MHPGDPVDPAGLAALVARRSAGRRRLLLGLVGPPGTGKSRLARALAAALDEAVGPGAAAVVPQDGFHLASGLLAGTELAGRRGAPDTFDPDGLAALLERLRTPGERTVFAPDFDRSVEEPLNAAVAVAPATRVVVVEGNYLLHPEPAWQAVRACLDEVWYVHTDPGLRRERLRRRHEQHGKDPDAARAWTEGPDEANARAVESRASYADLVVVNGEDGLRLG